MFIELAFHSIRRESYEGALAWVCTLIDLCPGVLEQLDVLLNTVTAVSKLPPQSGGTVDEPVSDATAAAASSLLLAARLMLMLLHLMLLLPLLLLLLQLLLQFPLLAAAVAVSVAASGCGGCSYS